MATTQKVIDVILQIRRDNDYNYKKIQNTFVPLKGEVCLVDTARNGLRAKVGDGIRTFYELQYADEDIAKNIIIQGYFHENQFYSDRAYTYLITPSVNKIYIEVIANTIYIYNGSEYKPITSTVSAATTDTAGIVKLYDTIGQNTDGTMTQKAITNELNNKVEASADIENETLVLSTDKI